MLAVTANAIPPPPWELTEGIVYRYELAFNFDDGRTMDLATATDKADLGYPPHTLPSFAFPPKHPNLLRLIQGSCRMPHAEGKDTFPLVDKLIAETASNAFARPHQLLLTGDQIYADDVAASMLIMLTDASDVLLDWKEVLPVPPRYADAGLDTAAQLSPFMRRELLNGVGFTSVDLDAHLLSLGEYLCMYLFVWSDALWTTTTLPLFADVVANVRKNLGVERLPPGVLPPDDSIERHIKALIEFRKTVPEVRRVLANIPSYMTFDDHEVTDDWNMTLDYCRALYREQPGLGLRVVQNALVAYALCQHWGNVPEQFADSTPAPPGLDLLRRLDTTNPTAANAFDQKAGIYNQNSKPIRSLLGVQEFAAIDKRKAVFHDPNSLQYHFTVEGPGHQVIFTDTRTWRSFPVGGNEPSELVPKDQFIRQIPKTPLNRDSTEDRVLLVVLSTNAPPVGPIRAAARHAGLARAATRHPDVYEAWEIPSVPFDRLLTTLTDKLDVDASGHHGRVILLSGDVHTSFASRLVYRATVRFEDQKPPKRATAVFAQLVASSFKKQTGDTVGFHRKGYRYAPLAARALGFIPLHQPEGYVGWNVAPDSGLSVGKKFSRVGKPGEGLERQSPLTLPTVPLQSEDSRNPFDVELSRTPDYRYRLDYLIASRDEKAVERPSIRPIGAGETPAQRKEAAKDFNTATAHYRRYNRGVGDKQDLVGVNNFGEITFEWGSGDNKKVNHMLRWHDPEEPPFVIRTTYTVSLNPNDADSSGKLNFPDIKAKRGDP